MNEEKQKLIFFKKFWNSIVKIEKYPDMAAEGVGRAFSYLCKVVAILAIVICIGMLYQTYEILQEGIKYMQNEFPEFSYQDGILQVSSEEKITISEEDSYIGKTIIDTKTEDEKTINQYINEIQKSGEGIIILKDKLILKNRAVSRNYKLQL